MEKTPKEFEGLRAKISKKHHPFQKSNIHLRLLLQNPPILLKDLKRDKDSLFYSTTPPKTTQVEINVSRSGGQT